MKRKYPCEAYMKGHPNGDFIVTVLSEKTKDYCEDLVYPIEVELPSNWPDPPKKCVTWLARVKNISFDKKKIAAVKKRLLKKEKETA